MHITAKLHAIALPIAFLVVVAGAYTRLSDAGLGCPDWPGCYGKMTGAPSEDEALSHSPGTVFDSRKTWIELGHRAVAGMLCLILFAAVVVAWRTGKNRAPACILALLVVLQALLGMLTVTEKLRPIIVVAHLVGGMLILFVLAYVATNKPLNTGLHSLTRKNAERLRAWAVAASIVLFFQIALGGLVSANHAGLACPDFPTCQGSYIPAVIDFSGLRPWRKLHMLAEGVPINVSALATIHWLHRAGAAATFVVISGFAIVLAHAGARGAGVGLMLIMIAQVFLGIAAVVTRLPLEVALAHNGFAALLAANIAVVLANIRKISAA